MNPVLCSIGQMDGGVYHVKPLKPNTLHHCRKSPGWRLEYYGLWNIFLAFFRFTHHCERHDGSIQVSIFPYGSCQEPSPICAFSPSD
ncbi:hypothetical protein TNIN_362601 [Trichonephila inaurata madagascariensis]|uniref:Uncharacterized protein n=1 Tax=Trichonephila inaurata madagascariensis TaxID=2747483 RepID=A0A8X6YF77_9ARAC|nr:hypothetical protein TNIN_362601 [Trichonephila inaurata madagascariensis]